MAPTNILRASNKKPQAAVKRPLNKPGVARQIVIRAGKVVLRARLLDTPTADRIWAQLPLYSTAERWGEALHFETTVETGREPSAKQNIALGEIGYWTEDDRIIIGFGMTPLSRAGEIRLPSPVNIWARALDDVTGFTNVRAGERVSVLHADS